MSARQEEKLRVAVVGSGYWGKNLVRNLHDLGVLTAVCDENQRTLQAINEQYPDLQSVESYEEILKEQSIQAVAIATPAETHGELVRRALLNGKDVFVEKPLCLSIKTAEELIQMS